MGHSHGEKSDKPWYKDMNVYRCFTMIFLTGVFMLMEVGVGSFAGSMALLADGFHMLSDMMSMIIGIASLMIAKKGRTDKFTYGFSRADVIGGFFNAAMVMSLVLSILIELMDRVFDPSPVKYPVLVLVVAIAGLVVNILGLFIFHDHSGHSHDHGDHDHDHVHGDGDHHHDHDHEEHTDEEHGDSHSEEEMVEPETTSSDAAYPTLEPTSGDTTPEEGGMTAKQLKAMGKKRAKSGKSHAVKGMFLHVLGDFMGSIAAIASGITMTIFQGHFWTVYVDIAMTLFIIVLLLRSAIPMLLRMIKILLQRVPNFVSLPELRSELSKVQGVRSFHELHVWQLSGERVIATVHIILHDDVSTDQGVTDVIKAAKNAFHTAGVHAVTIQPEHMQDVLGNSDGYCQLSLDCHYGSGWCCLETMRPAGCCTQGDCHTDTACDTAVEHEEVVVPDEPVGGIDGDSEVRV